MIFTIGYSNRTIGEFEREIGLRRITQVVDVRSSPWSRSPCFNRDRLARWAESSGRLYRWEGHILGGRSSFAPDSEPYRKALQHLVRALGTENIGLLCAEGNPEDCHRCFDVGAALLAFFNVSTVNIRRDGSEEGILETLSRLDSSRLHPGVTQALRVRASHWKETTAPSQFLL